MLSVLNSQHSVSKSVQVARHDLGSTQLRIGNGPPPAEGKLMFDGSPSGAGWVMCAVFVVWVSLYNACVCPRTDHRGIEIDRGGISLSRCVTLFNYKFSFI